MFIAMAAVYDMRYEKRKNDWGHGLFVALQAQLTDIHLQAQLIFYSAVMAAAAAAAAAAASPLPDCSWPALLPFIRGTTPAVRWDLPHSPLATSPLLLHRAKYARGLLWIE